MKILTKEEEDAHYREVLKGGISGLGVGLAAGLGTAYLFNRRWPLFRNTTLPFKAFYVCSTSTFLGIIQADRYSRAYELRNRSASAGQSIEELAAKAREERMKGLKGKEWLMEYGRENRYKIVLASWVASMGASLGLVWRDKYLSKAQKLVQARVYAQGLTLLVLIASAAFEVSDARNPGEKPKHVQHYPGEDAWKDIIKRDEQKMKDREELLHAKSEQLK